VTWPILWILVSLCALTAAPFYCTHRFRQFKKYEQAGRAALKKGELDRAVALLSKGLQYGNTDSPNMRALTIAATHNLALALFRQHKFAEAASRAKETVRLRTSFEPHSPEVPNSLALLCQIYERLGRFEETVTLRTWILDFFTEHVAFAHRLAAAHNDLGLAFMRIGDYDHARTNFEAAIPIERQFDGDPEGFSTFARSNRGVLHERCGEFEEAEKLWMEALAIRESPGQTGLHAARIRMNLAWMRSWQKRFEEAEGLANQALDAIDEKSQDNRTRASALHTLAVVRTLTGRLDEADQLFARVLEIRRAEMVPDHPDIVRVNGDIGVLRMAQGRLAEAEELFTTARPLLEAKLREQHPDLAAFRYRFGLLRARQGRGQEARDLLAAALAVKTRLAPEHPETLDCRKALEDFA
jgi:tetratricopeptide (TPR) repeat protein